MLPPILEKVGRFPVVWVPANPANTFQANPQPKREGVVCHIMEGTLTGCDSWFRNSRASASANFGISKSGDIHQYVKLYGDAPFANGIPARAAVTNAQLTAMLARHPGVNTNLLTWSIEHEGHSGEQITDYPELFTASTTLTATLMMDIDPQYRDTYGHYMFDPRSRSGCPGWSPATWSAYDAEVQRLIGEMEQAPSPPTPADHPDMGEVKRLMDSIYNATHQAAQDSADLFAEMRRLFPDGGI